MEGTKITNITTAKISFSLSIQKSIARQSKQIQLIVHTYKIHYIIIYLEMSMQTFYHGRYHLKIRIITIAKSA